MDLRTDVYDRQVADFFGSEFDTGQILAGVFFLQICKEEGKGGWTMPEESILLLLGLVSAMLAGCGAAGCFVSNTLSARSRFKKSAKYVDMNTFRVRPTPLKK